MFGCFAQVEPRAVSYMTVLIQLTIQLPCPQKYNLHKLIAGVHNLKWHTGNHSVFYIHSESINNLKLHRIIGITNIQHCEALNTSIVEQFSYFLFARCMGTEQWLPLLTTVASIEQDYVIK